MANKENTGEFSMDSYVNQRLSEDVEPNNPFEVPMKDGGGHKGKHRLKGKVNIKSKKFLIILAVIAVLVLFLILFIWIRKRQNDGARYARLLAKNIGTPISSARKDAGLDLKTESDYTTLNQLYISYQAIAESRKDCTIQGVHLPEWAIFCNTDANELTNVTYYNYELLEDSIFGTERKSYLDPQLIPERASISEVEKKLDLEPYRIQYLQDRTQLREYRYCYDDKETGDVVAYAITAKWDSSGALYEIKDIRRNYIGTLLSSPEA
ncbi:MAG: hypothetical protein IKQ39_08755 [Oscillospiraceae bacterium]|nr:hypothetical protein [Oscillospiraceae bacterium]